MQDIKLRAKLTKTFKKNLSFLRNAISLALFLYIYICICIQIHIHKSSIYIEYTHICIFIYIEREIYVTPDIFKIHTLKICQESCDFLVKKGLRIAWTNSPCGKTLETLTHFWQKQWIVSSLNNSEHDTWSTHTTCFLCFHYANHIADCI